jgi:hypothetical protein
MCIRVHEREQQNQASLESAHYSNRIVDLGFGCYLETGLDWFVSLVPEISFLRASLSFIRMELVLILIKQEIDQEFLSPSIPALVVWLLFIDMVTLLGFRAI